MAVGAAVGLRKAGHLFAAPVILSPPPDSVGRGPAQMSRFAPITVADDFGASRRAGGRGRLASAALGAAAAPLAMALELLLASGSSGSRLGPAAANDAADGQCHSRPRRPASAATMPTVALATAQQKRSPEAFGIRLEPSAVDYEDDGGQCDGGGRPRLALAWPVGGRPPRPLGPGSAQPSVGWPRATS